MSADGFQGSGESVMHDLSDAFDTLLSPQIPSRQFAGFAAHDRSPNPLLSVKGRGRIGIPLVYNDKKSPEETTGYATGNIRVAAKDVRIGNTAWSEWLVKKSSLVVEKDLGISPEDVALEQGELWLVSDPTMMAELSSLSASSPSTNHLGFLVVSLPSFAPYVLNLHHPDDKDECIFVKAETEDLSALTVVTAFYKKTVITLQTEGHIDGQARWSFLVYKLLYKAVSDTPVLPTTAGLLAGTLSGPVSKWIQWEHKEAPYLSYVLERHYSNPFKPKGRDLVRVKTFERLARELGLKMYVAEMTLKISGSTDREESPYGYDRVHYGYGIYDSDRRSSSEEDPYDMEMDDIDSEEVDVRYWTDWRSKVSQPHDVVLHRSYKYDVHILPSNFWDDIAEHEYTLVPTYDDDILTHTFTYTTVFLWPEKEHASVLAELFGQSGIRWLDPTLWNDTDEGRTQRDKFAEILINGLNARTKPKIQSFTCSDLDQKSPKYIPSGNETLFTFAYQQGRVDLVLKVVKAFGLPDISMVETAMAALKIKTDESIADFVLQCVDAEDVPIKKFQWIVSLNSGNEISIQSQINSTLKSEDLLQCLKTPDISILHSLLGSRLFCTCILPKLKSACDSSIWVAALRLIRADAPEDVKPYITRLVVQVASSMGQTAMPTPGYRPGHSGSSYTSTLDLKTMELFEFCLESPRELQLAATILDKFISFTLSRPELTDPSKLRAVLIGHMREVHIVLQRHTIPYVAHNSFPRFIQLALLNGILPGLGPRPSPPTSHTSYALKAVSCSCAHCKQLNIFLTSPNTSNTNIHTTVAGRDHLRNQLKSERNRAIGQHVQITAVGPRNGRTNLKKIKMATPAMAHALAVWETARREVEQIVKLVESGGALNGWGHLVLGVVRSGGMGWNKTAQEAVAMELKKLLPAKNTQSAQPTPPDRSAVAAISRNIDGGDNASTGIPPFSEVGQSGNGDAKRKRLNAGVDRDAKRQKQGSPVEIIELIDSDD